MALGERPLGLEGVLEAADAHHRQVDHLAQRRRDERRIPGRDVHRRLDHEQRRRRHPDRGVEVVDRTGGLHHLGHLDCIVDRGAALDQLVAAQPHAQCQVGADCGADRHDQLEQQAGTVGQRSSVAVGAAVGRRRQKPAHDRAVAALQLDPVETALGAVGRHQCVPGDDLLDLGLVDRLGHLAEQRVGHRRGRPHWQPRVHRRGLTAVVVDLGKDRRAVGVHRLGDRLVPRDHIAVEAMDQLLVRPVGRVSGVLLGDDQPGPALRTIGVVGDVLGRRATIDGVVGEVRREHHPVSHGHRPEPKGRPQQTFGHRFTASLGTRVIASEFPTSGFTASGCVRGGFAAAGFGDPGFAVRTFTGASRTWPAPSVDLRAPPGRSCGGRRNHRSGRHCDRRRQRRRRAAGARRRSGRWRRCAPVHP